MFNFYQICPTSLYNKELLNIRARLQNLMNEINQHNMKVGESFRNQDLNSFPDFLRQLKKLSNNDLTIQNILNKGLIMKYIDQSSAKPFNSYEEALVAILQETSRVYSWFRDVQDEERKLLANGIDTSESLYVSNIGFFIDLQTSLFSVAQALYKLNKELPKDFGLSELEVNQNTSLISGLYRINNYEMLLNYTYFLFEELFSLTSVHNDWMEHNHKNSSIETFLQQELTIIRLLKTLEPRYHLATWDNNFKDDIIASIRQRYGIADELKRENF